MSPPKPSACWMLATAERSTLASSRAIVLRVNCSVASAWLTFLPRISVAHQARLLGRGANAARDCVCFDRHDLSLRRRRRRGAAAFSVLVVCPLNVRVGENSPSLWPTMFSVTYTGMNFFPLCTAIVWPTISGTTVERRDQVLMTFFSLTRFIASSFSSSDVSTNGPFFSDLLITVLDVPALLRCLLRRCTMKRSVSLRRRVL